jgi:hypothetical protein
MPRLPGSLSEEPPVALLAITFSKMLLLPIERSILGIAFSFVDQRVPTGNIRAC